jgi:hypothetical protein
MLSGNRVWKVRHPNPAFTGFYGGIDFFDGLGTTSAVDIICKLLDSGAGFKVIATEQEQTEFRILMDNFRPKPAVKIHEKEGAWKALK